MTYSLLLYDLFFINLFVSTLQISTSKFSYSFETQTPKSSRLLSSNHRHFVISRLGFTQLLLTVNHGLNKKIKLLSNLVKIEMVEIYLLCIRSYPIGHLQRLNYAFLNFVAKIRQWKKKIALPWCGKELNVLKEAQKNV